MFLQAPVRLTVTTKSAPALSYPDILLNTGFSLKSQLLAKIKAWKALYKLLQPDLLIVDHAPGALLAALGATPPRVLFGSGFYVPPRINPMPTMRPWLNVPKQHLIESEHKVLMVINDVLKQLAGTPLSELAGLFDAQEDFLCTWPELDHYPNREKARYWGPRFALDQGVDANWPNGQGAKIFAYLNANYPDIGSLLQQLGALPQRVLVHVFGAQPALIRRHRTANLEFSSRPVNLSQVRQQASLAITHAGHGTTAAMLLAGCPLLLLPMTVEQFLVARNVANCQAGTLVHADSKKPNYRKLVRQILSDSIYRQGAERFAQKYADFDPVKRDEAIADRCEEILAQWST